MAAGRIVIPGWMPALDSTGAPIPNAQIYIYLNGTTTLATVYSDDTLTTPIANPVEANSSGQFPEIWADDANLFSVSVDAPYGPPGIPFTFDSIGPATVSAVIDVATDAGTAAANAVVATKANITGDNISASAFRFNIDAPTQSLFPNLTDSFGVSPLSSPSEIGSAISLAYASYDRIAIPQGLFITDKTVSNLSGRLIGPGQVQAVGGERLPPDWTWAKAPPASVGNYDFIYTAFNGELSSTRPFGHRVSGSQTLGQPSTGYLIRREVAGSHAYMNVDADAGWNQSTNSNDGRTGAVMNSTQVNHQGNGDAFAHWSSVGVSGKRIAGQGGPGTPTDVLAYPAGVVYGGQVLALGDDVYLNNIEQNSTDNGHRASAGTYVANHYRTNPYTGKNNFWFAYSAQSQASERSDVAFRVSGLFKNGLDTSQANVLAAVAMARGQRIYGSATADNARYGNSLGEDWIERTPFGFWNVVSENTSCLQVGRDQITALRPLKVDGNVGFFGSTPAAKPTVTGSRGGNAALSSLISALAALGLIADNTAA